MKKRILSGIGLGLFWSLLAGAAGSENRLSVELQYDSVRMDQRMLGESLASTTASVTTTTTANYSGKLQGQRGFLNIGYRLASGLQLQAIGGMALSPKLTGTVDTGTTTSSGSSSVSSSATTYEFDNAPVLGFGLAWDLFYGSRFHLQPGFRWTHASFSGTLGTAASTSTAQGSCTYDYSSGTAFPQNGCSTPVGNTFSSGSKPGLSTAFTEASYAGSLEASVDLFGEGSAPFLTLGGGVEETMTSLSGTATFTALGATTTSVLTETYSYQSAKQEGYYGFATIRLVGFSVGARYRAGAQNTGSVLLGMSF